MSFSSDLLDGFDVLNKRTEGVLKSGNNAADFFKSLSKIEKDYGKELKSLATKQRQSFQKASTSSKEVATMNSSWDIILSELEKIADHHSQYAQTIDNDVSKPVTKWCKDKVPSRNKLETDSERVRKDMKTQMENLSRARAKYVKLSKELDAAEAAHTKGKGDIKMKPESLARLAQAASQASDKAALADTEYQAALSLTNQKQSEYYLSIQPALLGEYQQFEEERLQYMKSILEKFSDVHAERPSFYTGASDSITAAARSVSVDSDVSAYVGENRTGVIVPADIQYIGYDSEVPAPNPKSPSRKSAASPVSGPSLKPGASSRDSNRYAYKASDSVLNNREWGLSASDKNLSDDQKKSKLNGQLDELDKAISNETKSKEGLENLVRFYASDPVAQKKAEDEIADCENKLSKLHETKHQVQSALQSIGGGSAPLIQVRGLYSYEATCDTELSFREGDILNVTEQDDSGWWYAEINGRSGFVPNNYVELIQ